MKYLCVNCWFVYDEAFWDKSEWILPWTKIEDLLECPVCNEIDTFNYINEEIIYMNKDTRDKYELAHFIDAKKENWKLLVTIWDNMHPMTEDHRICWLWLYDEYWDLVTEEFLWVDDDTTLELEDYELDEFEVRLKCSQHNLFSRKFDLNKKI